MPFDGRPQLAARFAGSGGGQSLLLNGHIDVVTARLEDGWTHDPFEPEVSRDRISGRGVVRHEGRHRGDGGGGRGAGRGRAPARRHHRLHEHGRGVRRLGRRWRARATACAPTTRSSRSRPASRCGRPAAAASTRRSTIRGRAGHAEQEHAHFRDGGAVNAIEKAQLPARRGRPRCGATGAAGSRRGTRCSPPDVVVHAPRRRLRLDRDDPEPRDADAGRADPPRPGRRRRLDERGARRGGELTCAAGARPIRGSPEHPPEFDWHTEVNPSETRSTRRACGAARRERRARAADDARRPGVVVRRRHVRAGGADAGADVRPAPHRLGAHRRRARADRRPRALRAGDRGRGLRLCG